MPHLGHVPGTSLSTPGHIGQKYAAPLLRAAIGAAASVAASPWQQPAFATTGGGAAGAWQQSCASAAGATAGGDAGGSGL
jgi:hypothetical protein